MFSLHAGCVKAGKPGHAYLFDSSSGESYIFLRNLAGGAQSNVQLVANVLTHEVVVRKVSKTKFPVDNNNNLIALAPDREAEILTLLNSLFHNPTHPLPSIHPRWTTCLSHEDLLTMSLGPRPRPVCARISYWKLCNGGSLADWARFWSEGSGPLPPAFLPRHAPFPVCVVARAIAQVCETLHFMYNAGPDPVYHCDLHLGNVFVHFEDGEGGMLPLPEFYLGDFGWARTAVEARADGEVMYGARVGVLEQCDALHPGAEHFSAPPGTAPPGQRRRWDVARFKDALDSLVRLAVPAKGWLTPPDETPVSEQGVALQKLMMMMQWLDDQDQMLAAQNPKSRPPSLLELARQAKKLEETALAAEQESEQLEAFITLGTHQARRIMKGGRPYVFRGQPSLTDDMRKAQAESYGKANIDGPWSLVKSV
ncbi:hypothetical protein VTI74DRAFT_4200 [Chaetomium olivicolor]